MPSRRDGRVEPGQPLRTAFSASAWNRAQDAADVVLGQRPGFGAEAGPGLPSRLFRNVSLLVYGSSRRTRFGMIVRQWNSVGANIPSNPSPAGQRPPNTVGTTIAEVSRPVAFVDRRTTANLNFAVIFAGQVPTTTSSSTGTQSTICTHGTCLAMVRKNPGGFLPRVRPAVIRYSSDTASNLVGIAEDSDCGTAEIVYWTNIKPFSLEQQTAEGIDPVETLDDTTNNIYYAVIRL